MGQRKTATRVIRAKNKVESGFPDLVCFSHLRWNYVYQRPQHLMSRFAAQRRVIYIEEPIVEDNTTRLEKNTDASGVQVVTPYLSKDRTKEQLREDHRRLISQALTESGVEQFVAWYYTPMALAYTDHLAPLVVVYDCMDDLSSFKGASERMRELEAALMQRAHLVFTGGPSLYEARKDQHNNIHSFPSSIDMAHFCQARAAVEDPADQAGIPHPRLGFFGVIDERMDLELVEQIADARPDWHLVMIGPHAKVNPDALPRRDNIHYLGIKSYRELPYYLAGWDVAMLPFALNESTRFISPTKTPEYLAGGRPVVSTPVRDVVRMYGQQGLVWIAKGCAAFVRSVDAALEMDAPAKKIWLERVDQALAQNSWENTWEKMSALVDSVCRKAAPAAEVIKTVLPAGVDEPPRLVEAVPDRRSRRNGGPYQFDYLIVGAGFAGSVLAERLACGSGKRVLIIDRRNHIGGNAYDHYNDDGLLVHKYGPHIFHTNSREVFTYLSGFTEWRPYEHRVRASVDGQLFPIPINLDTVNRMYGLNLSSFELEKWFESVAETRSEIRTSEDVVVSKIGRELYEKFFRNYTRKQWDLDPSDLDSSVTSRVPVRLNRDDRYFTDVYQAMPRRGFTRMFENLLDHPNIKIMLNTDYREIAGFTTFREMIFTGPVDEYFNYIYGRLPYRSLQFQFATLDEAWRQPVAVINYPNEHAYTRVTEFKHLTGQEHPKTALVYEYPCSEGDPYYPIPRPENAELYKKYKKLADSTPGVYFAGRLGTYKYYNMDQVTAQALTLYARLSGVRRNESAAAFTPSRFQTEIPCSLLVSQAES